MCSELDQFYTGKVLTNKYEAFELLVLFLLQKEGSLTYSYHNNEKMGLDISFEKEKLKISLNYHQDSALFEGYCKVDLKISFFMNPFYFKRYTVSDTKRFSNLTKVVNIMRMSSIFKRVTNKNRNIFGLLNKKTFTNGMDIRNKYLHGSNNASENAQQNDYYILLRILILILLKIEDDLIIRHSLNLQRAQE